MAEALRAVAALLAYGAAVIWLTWPLGATLTTHLPNSGFSCTFDSLLLGWALAHESRVLLSAPTELMHANIFHPDPNALLYGETGFGALPYFMPTFLFSQNPTLALNLTWLGSIILTVWMLHMVVVRWTGSMLAGGVAAGAFLTTRWVLWSHAPCIPTYGLLMYLPVIIALSAMTQPSRRRAVLLAALLFAQGLSNAYIAIAVLGPLTLLTLLRLVWPTTRAVATQSLAAIASATVVLLVIYSGHVVLRSANPDLTSQTWWGMRLEDRLPFGPFSYMTPLGVPLVFPLLAILGTVWSRVVSGREPGRRHPWGVLWFWTIVSALLSVSPVVWWRDTKLTVPYLALPLWWGAYEVIRIPDRLGVAALIALCLLAGLAFAELTAWVVRRAGSWERIGRAAPRVALGVLVLGLAYREYRHGGSAGLLSLVRAQGFKVRFPGAPTAFDPPPQFFYVGPLPAIYPIQPTASPNDPVMAALGASRSPLLEVPVGPGPGGDPAKQARAQYRSIFHRRPIVNGYSGYYPRDFPTRMALVRQLPDAAALVRLRSETGLASILVHLRDLPMEERDRWLAAQGGRRDLSLVMRDGDDLLFAVAPIDASP